MPPNDVGVAVAPPAVFAWRASRRAVQVSLVGLLVPVVLSILLVTLTSDHVQWPLWTALYKSYVVAAPVLIGAAWWIRRPASRIGWLLVAFGYAMLLYCWEGSNWSWLYTVGILGEIPGIFLNFYLLLAFPLGRLETKVDRAVAWAAAGVLAVFAVPWRLLQETSDGGGVMSHCASTCPPNALYVGSDPRLESICHTGLAVGIVLIPAALVAIYARRLVSASRPRRRALLTIAISSFLLLPAFIAFHFASGLLDVGADTKATIGWFLVAARILFPLGFLFALVEAEFFAKRSLLGLLADLKKRPSLVDWRADVAKALDDPSLQIAYLVSPAPELPGTLSRTIYRLDQPVAAMTMDGVLSEDPELVQAAVDATEIAVVSGSLESELRAMLARSIELSDSERRRLEQDLHDGAQQRLVALKLRIQRVREQLDGSEAAVLLAPVEAEADDAIAELRRLAAGAYPKVLEDFGPVVALRSLTATSPRPVHIDDHGIGRCASEIERTLYFCCAEAIQNALKHGGDGVDVAVALTRSETAIVFVVADTGQGFDTSAPPPGTGLENMRQRIKATAGSLHVESAAGRGTTVRGEIPLT